MNNSDDRVRGRRDGTAPGGIGPLRRRPAIICGARIERGPRAEAEMAMRRSRFLASLTLGAIAAAACTAGGGSGATVTPTSAVRVAPAKVVTKAASVAAMDAACDAFDRAEPPDPGDTATFAQMRAFAQGRTGSLADRTGQIAFRALPPGLTRRCAIWYTTTSRAHCRSIARSSRSRPSSTPANAQPLDGSPPSDS